MWLRLLGALILIVVVIVAISLWVLRPSGEPGAESAYFTGDDRYVEVEGETWRVRESGPENGQTLVLIHGFSHSLESFQPWADALDDTVRVIRFDLPGHGLTGPRADAAYSNEATTEQVADLLDVIAPSRFVIGGSSLGGLIAWRYAAAHPERVSGLVLVSPGGYSINGVGDEPVAVPMPVSFYLRTAPQAGVEAGTRMLYADPSRLPDGDADRIAALMRAEGNGEALVQRLQQFTLPDPDPILAQITAPALILWGEQDVMVPLAHAARFASAMPDARLVTYAEAGHVPMEELPAETSADVRAFLSGIAATSAATPG